MLHSSTCRRLIRDIRSPRPLLWLPRWSPFARGSVPTPRRSPSSCCVVPKRSFVNSRHTIVRVLEPSRPSLTGCAPDRHRISTRSSASGIPAGAREQQPAAARRQRVLAAGQPATRRCATSRGGRLDRPGRCRGEHATSARDLGWSLASRGEPGGTSTAMDHRACRTSSGRVAAATSLRASASRRSSHRLPRCGDRRGPRRVDSPLRRGLRASRCPHRLVRGR